MKKENSGEIVMYQPDETIRLEVRMGDDTVWLTQQQMAELFQTDRTSIVRHINNIYKSEELDKESTCAIIAQVQIEGNRTVKRSIPYFNLDDITPSMLAEHLSEKGALTPPVQLSKNQQLTYNRYAIGVSGQSSGILCSPSVRCLNRFYA